MSLRLEIRPCWKYECPFCDRVFRFPTTSAAEVNGARVILFHFEMQHDNADAPLIQWEKDHMANLREPT